MIEIAHHHKTQLGEGPVWDERTGLLYWIDIAKGAIHALNTLTHAHHYILLHQRIGSIALCEDDNLLVAADNGLLLLNKQGKTLFHTPFPETQQPGNRFNDGKCDANGRFWVGTMATNEAAAQGSLYCINAQFRHSKICSRLTIPNGMAWSRDQKKFYFIDTPENCVRAYAFDSHSGRIDDGKKILSIDVREGHPDGMTIDAAGMLWIAHWDGWQVSRWNPETGEKLFSLPLPVARVTSCTFGGTNLDTLYITTAYDRLTSEQKEAQPLAGALFVWKNSGFQGLSANRFKYDLPDIP